MVLMFIATSLSNFDPTYLQIYIYTLKSVVSTTSLVLLILIAGLARGPQKLRPAEPAWRRRARRKGAPFQPESKLRKRAHRCIILTIMTIMIILPIIITTVQY